MPILEEITFSGSFETVSKLTGLPEWWKGGGKFTLVPGDDPKECIKLGHQLISEAFKEANSEFIDRCNGNAPEPPTVQINDPKSALNAYKEEISKCKSIEELRTYQLIVSNNPQLTVVYKLMTEKLSKN